ncbi:MAG: rod shape-determining protein MreD [Nitrospinota bacterium]
MFIAGVILLAFFAMALETTFLGLIKIRDIKPDLVLICSLYCAFYVEKPKAMAAGFFMGLVQDALTFGPLGVHAILNCFVVFIVSSSRENYLNENTLVEWVLSVVTIFLSSFVLAIVFLVDSGRNFSMEIWKDIFVMTGYTILFLPPLFAVITFFKTRFEKMNTGRVWP